MALTDADSVTGDTPLLLRKNGIIYIKTIDDISESEWVSYGGEKEYNNLELANLIAKIMGKNLKYEIIDFHSTRPGHDLRYALDGAKMKQSGWQPPLSFEESLETTINWTLDNPQWLDI